MPQAGRRRKKTPLAPGRFFLLSFVIVYPKREARKKIVVFSPGQAGTKFMASATAAALRWC